MKFPRRLYWLVAYAIVWNGCFCWLNLAVHQWVWALISGSCCGLSTANLVWIYARERKGDHR
jgi:hypothetical protein